MTQKDNILQELKELQSPLAEMIRENAYRVPAGYFEELADQVLRRVKAMDAVNAKEELSYLSPVLVSVPRAALNFVPAGYFDTLADQVLNRIKEAESNDESSLSPLLNSISKKMPYTVPAGYFDDLAETALSVIKYDEQSAEEELEELSPLLSGLKKEMPYSVPEGYFKSLDTEKVEVEKPVAKVVPMGTQKWFRYAAAAVVTGIVVLSGFFFFKKPIDPKEQSFAWVKKSLKNVDEKNLDSFVQMVDEEAEILASVDVNAKTGTDIKEMIKDIPDEEVEKFLDEAGNSVDEENIGDEIFVN